MKTKNIYAIIMAGGSGKRFWPRSRETHPKQLINIIGEKTMLQETIGRLDGLIPLKNVYIVTNHKYAHIIKSQLPEIPQKNILIEPIGRNTAACIGLASIYIVHDNPEAITCVLPADHLIQNKNEFQETLKLSFEIANKQDSLITIGIEPVNPETGYGYIKIKSKIKNQKSKSKNQKSKIEYYEVEKFVEKPNLKDAEYFLQTRQYLWNSGMFVWKAKKILHEIKKYLPDLYKGLEKIKQNIGGKDEENIIKNVYPEFENISIDYGIMEESKGIICISGKFGWSDLGTWAALYDVLKDNDNANVVIGNHVGLDSKGLFVWAPDKLVTTIGVDNIVIVETHDSILICRRDRSQDIKKLTELLESKGLKKYL